MAKMSARARRARVNRGVRLAVQIAFFLLFPAAFSAAENGVKAIFTQIGLMQPVPFSGFVAFLAVLAAYTVVAGRFFCGYACAFGTLGDVLFVLLAPVRRRFHLPARPLPPRVWRALQGLKYVVLAAICALCFAGAWDSVSDWSPWTAFASLRAGNVGGVAVAGGVLLALIAVGMLFIERFFCQFLCPLGALLSLLPVLPFSAFRRDRTSCLAKCDKCKRSCPVAVHPDPDAFLSGECIACGRCADGCPAGNVGVIRSPRFVRGTEIIVVLVKAAVLAALCWMFL